MFQERKCKVFNLGLEDMGKVGEEIASFSLRMFSFRPFVLPKKLLATDLDDDEM